MPHKNKSMNLYAYLIVVSCVILLLLQYLQHKLTFEKSKPSGQ